MAEASLQILYTGHNNVNVWVTNYSKWVWSESRDPFVNFGAPILSA